MALERWRPGPGLMRGPFRELGRLEREKEEDHYCCERWAGGFERSLTLPAGASAEKIKATFKNGVLEVHLPKVEKAKGKRIEIKVE